MKIIIDTNIIFSAILNTNGMIGDLIFNSQNIFDFYGSQYMKLEINNHWERLKNISKLSDGQIEDSYLKIISKINFIEEGIIPKSIWLIAEDMVKDIDIDDIDFIALTLFLDGTLWTGDKKLYEGLEKKSFHSIYNTKDLLEFRTNKLNN